MTPTTESIVRGLSEAQREALIEALVCDDGGARLRCNGLYSQTITALERRGLVQFNCLRPLGLEVKALLERSQND